MKKIIVNSPVFFLALVLCLISYGLISSTTPSGFENYSEMGASVTGLAMGRSYYNGLTREFQDPPGYIYNGTYTVYSNWPSFGFMVIAKWLKLLNGDSLSNARLLPSILYALSSILFFLLLIRLKIGIEYAFIAAILFTVLPHHLEYGKMIFSDMWLIPFWLIACHLIISKWQYQIMIIPLAVIGTLGFMWFVAFIIPAYFMIAFYKCRRITGIRKAGIIILMIIAGRLGLMLFVSVIEETYLTNSLLKWVEVFSYGIKEIGVSLGKRLLTLVYELIPLSILLLPFLRNNKRSEVCRRIRENKPVYRVLGFLTCLYVFYIAFLPKWFMIHAYGIPFFSIIIGLLAALLLQMCAENKRRVIAIYPGILAIFLSLILFWFYPFFSPAHKRNEPVNAIVDWLNDKNEENQKYCVFFDLSDEVIWHHAFEFGIKETTRNYVFSSDSINSFDELPENFTKGVDRLKSNQFYDFDESTVYFVTNRPDSLQLHFTDSMTYKEFHVYEIEL